MELIDFNDEIIEIIELDDDLTIDIEVDGDHLFYANGVLTHNSSYGAKDMGMESISESIGIPQTADVMVSFILDEQRPDIRIMSILKSRAVNKQKFKPTIVNCSTEYQRLWDLDEGERKYLKSSNKEVLKEMETIIELDEELTKTTKETGAKPDDMLGKLLSQNF